MTQDLAPAAVPAQAERPAATPRTGDRRPGRWHSAVIHRAYVRSSADSDGAGIADRPGGPARLPADSCAGWAV